MPKKTVRVVTADTAPIPQPGVPSRRVVVVNTNPKVSNSLTANEVKARMQNKKRYITATTTGALMSRSGSDTMDTVGGNFYSPQLSTDFLEKPQNLRERRAFYRFFYNTNEYVGAAIDKHTTIPMSKVRLVPPKSENKDFAQYVFKFFQDMCDNIKLFKTLIEITHEFNLFGNTFSYAEEHDPYENITEEELADKKEKSKNKKEYLLKKFNITDNDPAFKGWRKIIILPPDQVRIRKIPLTDETVVEFVPDGDTRRVLTSESPLSQNDQEGNKARYAVPSDIKNKLIQNGAIPLDTDPDSGSFVHHLARKKSQYEPLGVSMIERCINTLVLIDKLRQAQTSIASRHMTPMRIVWAEDLSDGDVDNLREQVDLALIDPDFSIVANYEVHWEEMGSNGRILDLTAEYESAENRLMAGLETTKEVLTGEGSYAGNRISLEVMNTMYLLYREIIQDYVENYLFKPIARKKGFIEYDKFGNEILLYPKLSFTRLAIRDNETFFDAVFQLYNKGSVSIDLILELLNIDPESTKEKIEKDLFTVNDNQFNELMRNIYVNLSTGLTDRTDLLPKLATYLNLNLTGEAAAPEGTARFSSQKVEKPKVVSGLSPEQQVKLSKVLKYFTAKPENLDRLFKNVP